MRLKTEDTASLIFVVGGVRAQTDLQFIIMRLQTVKSEVGRVLASTYKSIHKSQAGSDQSTVILGADAFMHVIVLFCVMKPHKM